MILSFVNELSPTRSPSFAEREEVGESWQAANLLLPPGDTSTGVHDESY